MSGLQRGIAVPNFAEDPAGLIELGVAAEQAGFDGFFLWDHIVFSNTGDGPPLADPWLVLAVIASRTSQIRLGTMITPVPRRRPWQLARETTTLDRLSGGRLILGVGIGSPAYGDFGIFHEPQGARERADLLDEGLDVMAGLWTGERVLLLRPALPAGPGAVPPDAGAAAADPGVGRRRAAQHPARRTRRPLGRHGADPVRRRRPGDGLARRHRRLRGADQRRPVS